MFFPNISRVIETG